MSDAGSLQALLTALRSSPTIAPLLHAIAGPRVAQKLPGPGFIDGTLHLNPQIAPAVPEGVARPLAPGEWVQNPNGSWSSEMTMTVSGDKSFNEGKPTVIPSLWIKDGKPYVATNEDEATALAKASGLEWPSFADMNAAEKFANDREAGWQHLSPQIARSVDPIYRSPDQFIEPPAAKTEKRSSLDGYQTADQVMAAPTPTDPAAQRELGALQQTIASAQQVIAKPEYGEAGKAAFGNFVNWLLPAYQKAGQGSLDPHSKNYLFGFGRDMPGKSAATVINSFVPNRDQVTNQKFAMTVPADKRSGDTGTVELLAQALANRQPTNLDKLIVPQALPPRSIPTTEGPGGLVGWNTLGAMPIGPHRLVQPGEDILIKRQ